VEPLTRLACLVLRRDTFVSLLGPLEALMAREKSAAAVSQRLARLQTKGAGVPAMPAEVLVKRRRRPRPGGPPEAWEVVRARGHLDEVQALRSAAAGARAPPALPACTEHHPTLSLALSLFLDGPCREVDAHIVSSTCAGAAALRSVSARCTLCVLESQWRHAPRASYANVPAKGRVTHPRGVACAAPGAAHRPGCPVCSNRLWLNRQCRLASLLRAGLLPGGRRQGRGAAGACGRRRAGRGRLLARVHCDRCAQYTALAQARLPGRRTRGARSPSAPRSRPPLAATHVSGRPLAFPEGSCFVFLTLVPMKGAEPDNPQHFHLPKRAAARRAEEASGRQYALKRMRKAAVVQCPEHVFCEQAITRNTAHPFCIRQYASFQARARAARDPDASRRPVPPVLLMRRAAALCCASPTPLWIASAAAPCPAPRVLLSQEEAQATAEAACCGWRPARRRARPPRDRARARRAAQDKYHLYLLFDLMSGGDLMDVLVAEARVVRRRIAQGAWRRACLAPKARAPPRPPSRGRR